MSKSVLTMLLLASPALASLGGCVTQQTLAPHSQALQTDARAGEIQPGNPPPSEQLREECSGASTADMYRYCLRVGPEEALRNDPAMSGQPMQALQTD